MEEVDGILIYTLKQIGCDVGGKIGDLTPSQLIQCTSKCMRIIQSESGIPEYDLNVSMSARYKVASEIAQAITDMGYKDEIGCQSFLYPTELETRKLLIFMVEKLPRDSEVGEQIETLLSKISLDKKREELLEEESRSNNGFEVDGIKLPIAVDVDSLPKETLKFYASHLADLTFAKTREKYRNKPSLKPTVPDIPLKTEDSDDDFGDPDEDLEKSATIETFSHDESSKKEKPKLAEKPKIKPTVPEKPKVNEQFSNDAADAERSRVELETIEKIKTLQDYSKVKAQKLKEFEQTLTDSNDSLLKLRQEFEKFQLDVDAKQKVLDRLRKTDQLLSGEDDALKKVKTAVAAQVEKIMSLSNQWEQHRKPLVDQIRSKQWTPQTSETSLMRDDVRNLKAKMKLMGQEARGKEELCKQLLTEYEKLPKDLSRSSYTRRITEIIGNIKKQKKEITKVLNDTKEIQKDINTLTGRLDRTFAVADELIYKDAEKDKNVAQSYKLLVAIHSDFSKIIHTVEEIGNLKRSLRDFEDKLELERGKNVEDKLKRLKADMTQMKHENRILEAKQRDPTLIRKSLTSPSAASE